MQRETVFCKSSHSPQGVAGKRGGADQREQGETQRPGGKQGSPAPGSGPAPDSTSSPSSHPPRNCSSSSRAERGGIWVLRYPSRQCSLEMLTKDRREQSQLLSEEPVLPRWESPTVPSPTFSDFAKTWKLRCRETRRKEWAVPKPGAWLCDWQPGSAAPGRGWEVGGRQIGVFAAPSLTVNCLADRGSPPQGRAGLCVFRFCPGGGSWLGILPVPARQSSVAPGMRLQGQLFSGCFEEG